MMRIILIALFCLSLIANVHAQEPSDANQTFDALAADLAAMHHEVEALSSYSDMQEFVRTVRSAVPVYERANINSSVILELPKGSTLQVVDDADDWLAVPVRKDREPQRTGWIQASSVIPEFVSAAKAAAQPDAKDIYQALLNQVTQFRNKYSKNPYVKITGFTIDISIPPSVGLEFEFK